MTAFRKFRNPEPTRSGTFLSVRAIFQPKRKISKAGFSWVEPLRKGIWNLFEMMWTASNEKLNLETS